MADRIQYPFLRSPYAFKVCRIEPENNVHEVLEAFSTLPKHIFVIVGNWNKSEYGINLRKKYGAYSNIFMLDPIYNQITLDTIRGNAFVYIHGHSAGGTNPSLVEAMYLGLPVIAFRVSYNRTTTDNKALYFSSSSELAEMIQKTPVTRLKEIGATMGRVARARYTWKQIATKYAHLIQEVLVSPRKVAVIPRISLVTKDVLLSLEVAHLKYANHFFEKR
jgi:glycosyltransferase involved in cell wall biosynthesis